MEPGGAAGAGSFACPPRPVCRAARLLTGQGPAPVRSQGLGTLPGAPTAAVRSGSPRPSRSPREGVALLEVLVTQPPGTCSCVLT